MEDSDSKIMRPPPSVSSVQSARRVDLRSKMERLISMKSSFQLSPDSDSEDDKVSEYMDNIDSDEEDRIVRELLGENCKKEYKTNEILGDVGGVTDKIISPEKSSTVFSEKKLNKTSPSVDEKVSIPLDERIASLQNNDNDENMAEGKNKGEQVRDETIVDKKEEDVRTVAEDDKVQKFLKINDRKGEEGLDRNRGSSSSRNAPSSLVRRVSSATLKSEIAAAIDRHTPRPVEPRIVSRSSSHHEAKEISNDSVLLKKTFSEEFENQEEVGNQISKDSPTSCDDNKSMTSDLCDLPSVDEKTSSQSVDQKLSPKSEEKNIAGEQNNLENQECDDNVTSLKMMEVMSAEEEDRVQTFLKMNENKDEDKSYVTGAALPRRNSISPLVRRVSSATLNSEMEAAIEKHASRKTSDDSNSVTREHINFLPSVDEHELKPKYDDNKKVGENKKENQQSDETDVNRKEEEKRTSEEHRVQKFLKDDNEKTNKEKTVTKGTAPPRRNTLSSLVRRVSSSNSTLKSQIEPAMDRQPSRSAEPKIVSRSNSQHKCKDESNDSIFSEESENKEKVGSLTSDSDVDNNIARSTRGNLNGEGIMNSVVDNEQCVGSDLTTASSKLSVSIPNQDISYAELSICHDNTSKKIKYSSHISANNSDLKISPIRPFPPKSRLGLKTEDIVEHLERLQKIENDKLHEKMESLHKDLQSHKMLQRSKMEIAVNKITEENFATTTFPHKEVANRYFFDKNASKLRSRLKKLENLKSRISVKLDKLSVICEPSSPEVKNLTNIKDSLNLAMKVCESSLAGQDFPGDEIRQCDMLHMQKSPGDEEMLEENLSLSDDGSSKLNIKNINDSTAERQVSMLRYLEGRERLLDISEDRLSKDVQNSINSVANDRKLNYLDRHQHSTSDASGQSFYSRTVQHAYPPTSYSPSSSSLRSPNRFSPNQRFGHRMVSGASGIHGSLSPSLHSFSSPVEENFSGPSSSRYYEPRYSPAENYNGSAVPSPTNHYLQYSPYASSPQYNMSPGQDYHHHTASHHAYHHPVPEPIHHQFPPQHTLYAPSKHYSPNLNRETQSTASTLKK